MRIARLPTLAVGVAAALAVGIVLAAGVVLGTGEVAFAHAKLVETNPANQSVLDDAPEAIELRFTEPVDPLEPAMRLLGADGDEVPLGPVDQSGGADTLRAEVPDGLDDGTYVVGWQAVSADSHTVRGAFTFSVGAATATAPGVIDGIFDAVPQDPADSVLLGVGRWLSFAGIGVLLGGLVIAPVIAARRVGDRRVGRLLAAAGAVGVVGTIVMIAAQARLLTGSFVAFGDVVDTRSGRWWFSRLAVVIAALIAVRFRAALAHPAGRAITAAAALGVLVVVAAGGHGVAGDHTTLGFPATVIHLTGMSLWLGGLAMIAVALPRADTWTSASAFSPWALGSVVALAASGSVNAWRQLGAFSNLVDSSFGRWLVIKLALVLGVIVVASFSRRTLRLRAEGDAATTSLHRTVTIEAVGVVVVLMATAGLVNSPPPPPVAVNQSASVIVGDRIVQVELEPAATEGGELHVYLTSPSGGLDQPDEITVDASLPAANLGPIDIEVVPAGPNHVVATEVVLPVAGRWTFEVTARFGEFDEVVFLVELPVSD